MDMVQCRCGFRFSELILAKTGGYCPVCKEGRDDHIAKYGQLKYSKKVN